MGEMQRIQAGARVGAAVCTRVGVCVPERCCRLIPPCGLLSRRRLQAVDNASAPGFAVVIHTLMAAHKLPPGGRWAECGLMALPLV